MSARLGRNDPCHCGSGKKYKKCHWLKDHQRGAPAPPSTEGRERTARLVSRPETRPIPDISSLARDPQRTIRLMGEMLRAAKGKERAELEKLLAETKPVLEYLNAREEIESAAAILEEHRAEFERLTEDEQAYFSRARTLFDEERFSPFRFAPAEIERAFQSVGYPPVGKGDDPIMKCLESAILHLADAERRARLSRVLLHQIPSYVAAGRYLDGWVVQHCAYLTTESAQRSNAFLLVMFLHGVEAWVQQRVTREESILKEIGLNPKRVRGMSMEEVDTWIEAQQADPAKRDRLEAVLNDHPDQRAEAIANFEQMESDALKLLELADGRSFLLPPEAIAPWLPELSQRWQDAVTQHPELLSRAPPDELVRKIFGDVILSLTSRIAESIFAPERIQHLVRQLKAYRNWRDTPGPRADTGRH